MRTTLTIQDIRNLLSRSKTVTAFRSKIDLEEVAKNFRELVEMVEIIFLKLEKLEESQRKNKEYEGQIKKLHQELDRVKVGLLNIARAAKNGKD